MPVVEKLKTVNVGGEGWVEENARRGPLYEKLLGTPEVLHPLLAGEMSYQEAADMIGTTRQNMQRLLIALRQDALTEREAAAWELREGPRRLLGPAVEDAPPAGSPEWELFIETLTDAFVEWRTTYMQDERGRPYLTKPFHRRWIRSILQAIFTGGRLMILSPPRHGKTQLLIDFCTWMIIRDPHVRILWIASNEDLAGDWLQAVQEQLEVNEKLRRDYLPPGADWKPGTRSGKTWSRHQFKAATRTRPVKSPTMKAGGRGGRILSRDVDLMIVDDIEDFQSTIQPKAREDTRKWFAQDTGSRKLESTAVVVIGSRQHPDDLYGHLLDNPEWDTIVEEAHQSGCRLDPLDESLHTECMLFPEMCPYSWYSGQRRSFAITGGESLFLMVYQNVATAEGLVIFDAQKMMRCRTGRHIGQIPPGSRLIAGLDPATTGYQASFLWGWNAESGRFSMIDLENTAGAGIPGWRDLLQRWFENYHVEWWVVEDVAAQRGYLQDAWVVSYVNAHGIRLLGHQTGNEKWDKHIGVTAMASLFAEDVTERNPVTGLEATVPKVDLPYGTPEAKAKTDLLVAQATHFSQAASQNRNARVGYKSDVLMAAWFPLKVIRNWGRQAHPEKVYQYAPAFGSFDRVSWDEPPWGRS